MTEIKLAPGVPETEFDFEFVQATADTVSAGYFKYGPCAVAYPDKVDAIASLEVRLKLYKDGGIVQGQHIAPGNPAYLVNIAFFAMMAYRYPDYQRYPKREEWDLKRKTGEVIDTNRNSPGRVRVDNASPDATNDGISQVDCAAQSRDYAKTQGAKVYKREGD